MSKKGSQPDERIKTDYLSTSGSLVSKKKIFQKLAKIKSKNTST